MEDIEKTLDVIELSFKYIDIAIRGTNYNNNAINIRCTPDEAIQELNERFKENGVGYQFENGQLIKVDSKFTHTETIKPVLALLQDTKRYKGANQEF